jgi:hypothetical protein
MKRTSQAVLAMAMMITLLSLAAVAGADPTTPNIDRREVRQDRRIEQGVKSGELTRGETRRLVRGEARIDRMEARAKRNGIVTRRERAHIERAQNRESRRIYRLKHNARVRKA